MLLDCASNNKLITYPRAKIGVSGRLSDVCSRCSSRGLCTMRFGKPFGIMRLRVFVPHDAGGGGGGGCGAPGGPDDRCLS